MSNFVKPFFRFQSAIELVNYINECCLTNPKVDEENLQDLLEDIMDQEFHTVCDDNSPKEISMYLIKYLNMLKNGQMEQIRGELSQLPPCEIWIVAGRKINFVSKLEDESSSDDDDDDEDMETSDVKISKTSAAPSTSGSTMQVMEEDVDPGWTVVKTKKKK
jgi:pre-rRNA-processing protein TSR2